MDAIALSKKRYLLTITNISLNTNPNLCFFKQKTREEADQFCRNHEMQLVWLQTKEESEKVSELVFENGKKNSELYSF